MSTKTNGGKSPNPEVSERATRRRFSAEYKLGILEEADRCALGEQGALLRREGLYSSHLVKWREQRSKGALAALSKKRGRKVERTPAATPTLATCSEFWISLRFPAKQPQGAASGTHA